MRSQNFQHFSLQARAAIQASAAVGLLALLMLTPLRRALEASMSLHMLAQYPALMLAGALFGAAGRSLPQQIRDRLSAWNVLGISGLAACVLFLTVLMIPRVLDLALTDPSVEAAKVLALMGVGAVLWPSWCAAGLVVQSFFMGNVLPMTFIVGTLYRDSPQRLCNAYRLDDQQDLGLALVWIVVAVAVVWLLGVGYRLSRPSGALA